MLSEKCLQNSTEHDVIAKSNQIILNFKIFLEYKSTYIDEINEMRNLRFRILGISYFSESRKLQGLEVHNQDPKLYFSGGLSMGAHHGPLSPSLFTSLIILANMAIQYSERDTPR